MDKILTKEERSKLLVQHKIERDKRIADRIKVVLLSDDNWGAEAIAEALFIDDATVRRHLNTYKGSVASIIEGLLEVEKLRFWTLCSH